MPNNTISQQPDERAQQLLEVVSQHIESFTPELVEERLNNIMEGFLESNYTDDGPQLRDHYWTVREIIAMHREFFKILKPQTTQA